MHQLIVPSHGLDIGVDHDDVLSGFMQAFIAFHNKTYRSSGEPLLQYENISTFHFEKLLGIDRKTLEDRFWAFYASPEFRAIQATPGARDALEELTMYGHRFHVVTSRPGEVAHRTANEIDTFYKGLITSQHHLGHISLAERPGQERPRLICKGEKSQELGIYIFIDDGYHNIERLADYGIATILMRRPWNIDKELPQNGAEARHWREIPHLIHQYMMRGKF